jgi:energy-coupling factor transporter ATP-binding protein EcfA2
MYVKKIDIKNIRAVTGFTMNFNKPEGWHVIIGDNGAGKSTIIRSVALTMVGPKEIYGIKPNWNKWLNWSAKFGSIEVEIQRSNRIDVQGGVSGVGGTFKTQLKWKRLLDEYVILDEKGGKQSQAKNTLWGGKQGWFSAGYGPFRRFTGGSFEMDRVFDNPSYSRLASHLSLFGEDVALSEATKWLMNLKFQTLEKTISANVIDDLKKFINSPEFLPHKTKLKSIGSEGVNFVDGNGAAVSVTEMSDGYRSILSLTFELLRQLIRVYGDKKVFRKIREGVMEIDLPGVVLIDEVDAHLHPSWQTKIGEWFIKYFPKIQFIVTTHSPLICRASHKGSIWRLSAPGHGDDLVVSGEVTGDDKNRLIYGNVLDAYGTDLFGEAITISKEGTEKRNQLAKMNIDSIMGKPVDKTEFQELKKIFPTEKLSFNDKVKK